MQLTSQQLEGLVRQARRDAPSETCGLIAGIEDRAKLVYPLKNVDATPITNYLADPQEQLHALRDIEERGLVLLAIYHSHPASAAFPSPTDIQRAYYPEALYLVISLENAELATVRAFAVREGRVNEVTLEIEDEDESQGASTRRAQKRTGRPRAGRAVAPLSKGRSTGRGARGSGGRIPKQV